MVNAMEWLYSQEKYNTREKREGARELKILMGGLEGHLDLREFVNLTKLDLSCNRLTSIDFLKQLPHPEKLTCLRLAGNNIEPTNLEFLRPFVNLTEKLTLGNDIIWKLNKNIYNRFYGSLEPLKNMTKLQGLCIDGTDVEEGLEYLPYLPDGFDFDCSPKLPNQKVAKIQNELRLFSYNLKAWQLAHPEKMLISRPECFTNPDSKEKWIKALADKITTTQAELQSAKDQEADKLSKIVRLEATIQELTQAKTTISQQTQTEFSTQNQGTQTDLTVEQITQLENQNQNLLKLLQATEQELTNTKNQLTNLQKTLAEEEKHRQRNYESAKEEAEKVKIKNEELKLAQEKIKELDLQTEKQKEIQNQLTNQSATNQEQIKQLQSKIKLLELQKENYQTKYDKSINFIKEIREDIAKNT